LFFNDDVGNKHRKNQKKERDERDPREIMFNDVSLGFEGVEDKTRREMVVMELNSWVTWELQQTTCSQGSWPTLIDPESSC
jgi:hypothetical protein